MLIWNFIRVSNISKIDYIAIEENNFNKNNSHIERCPEKLKVVVIPNFTRVKQDGPYFCSNLVFSPSSGFLSKKPQIVNLLEWII